MERELHLFDPGREFGITIACEVGMSVFREIEPGGLDSDIGRMALGALTGLAIGFALSRVVPREPALSEWRDRARKVARRMEPGRLQRLAPEQDELDRLEERVLRAFLDDEILSERGIDIGAISVGIVELSGSVGSEMDADRAVSLASRMPGVKTVVNRITVESSVGGIRRPLDEEQLHAAFAHQDGRVGGMGRRRQSALTDPDRSDDSQKRRENALAAADRRQWEDEGIAPGDTRGDTRAEERAAASPDFREDEMDNQDPQGRRPDRPLQSPPEELNSAARVGETMKPAIRLDFERANARVEGDSPRDHDR